MQINVPCVCTWEKGCPINMFYIGCMPYIQPYVCTLALYIGVVGYKAPFFRTICSIFAKFEVFFQGDAPIGRPYIDPLVGCPSKGLYIKGFYRKASCAKASLRSRPVESVCADFPWSDFLKRKRGSAPETPYTETLWCLG